jgi:UDP-N-acetylglucosamine diphosphorylase/glucosamine-1-phosphate N-acetyltransferase
MMTVLPDYIAVVILAAGKGTRMKSDIAKVLHIISGRPMISYVVETAVEIAGTNVVVVVGNQAEQVRKIVLSNADVRFAIQREQRGTGHAVKCALPVLPEYCNEVVILSGDVPLIKASTVQHLLKQHIANNNDVTLLAVEMDNPFGYGRVLLNKTGDLNRIVEETDATDREKCIKIINSGIYCVKKEFLEFALSRLQTNNMQKEVYLTDIIEIAFKSKKRAGLVIGKDPTEILGVNTPEDLRSIESLLA